MLELPALRAVAVVPVAVLALSLASSPLLAQGGPPLITDDPDTPGPHHWEINVSLFRTRTPHDRVTEQPRLDLNYGVGRRIQLKLEDPLGGAARRRLVRAQWKKGTSCSCPPS